MSFDLQQAPDRLRKTLYRSDHFWVDTRNAVDAQPRYQAGAFASNEANLKASNEEAVVSISLDGSSPYRDVYIDSAATHLYVNNKPEYNTGLEAGQIFACSRTDNYNVVDMPVWYSNSLCKVSGTYYTSYKTKWNPSYKPATGGSQTSEMREPVGLSRCMLYYRRCTPYQKKFRITFTPVQTNRLRSINTTDQLQGLGLAGANANDDYDAPLMLKNSTGGGSTTTVCFGQPYEKILIGGFENATPQYAKLLPFWIDGKKYPIPISKSEEGFKLGVFRYKNRFDKPIVWEYTTSIKSTYGKKVDMAEVYYTNEGGAWAANNAYPTYVNMFLYTLENSPDSGFIPYIQGHIRIESWVDCLFWDRKQVQVAFNLSTEEAGAAITSIAANEEELELEPTD